MQCLIYNHIKQWVENTLNLWLDHPLRPKIQILVPLIRIKPACRESVSLTHKRLFIDNKMCVHVSNITFLLNEKTRDWSNN